MKKPDYLISLASKAMLVNAEIKVWSATRQNSTISEEVTTAKNADKSAGKFIQNLLADDPRHKALLTHRQSVYNWMKKQTYDWSGSQRILPFSRFESFKEEFRKYEAEHDRLKEDFCSNYGTTVAQMAFSQGTMFDKTLYPTEAEVRSRFNMKLHVCPVPLSDFRCAVAQEIVDDLNQYYTDQANEQIADIMSSVGEQLFDYVRRIAHACSEPEDGKRKPKVYDSTINGVRELMNTIDAFNVTDDTRINDIRKSIDAVLSSYTASDIRDSDAVKSSIKSGMDDILSKFSI